MTDDRAFTASTIVTYEVRERVVTTYEVVRTTSNRKPNISSFGFAAPVCECADKDRAERIAKLLAEGE